MRICIEDAITLESNLLINSKKRIWHKAIFAYVLKLLLTNFQVSCRLLCCQVFKNPFIDCTVRVLPIFVFNCKQFISIFKSEKWTCFAFFHIKNIFILDLFGGFVVKCFKILFNHHEKVYQRSSKASNFKHKRVFYPSNWSRSDISQNKYRFIAHK